MASSSNKFRVESGACGVLNDGELAKIIGTMSKRVILSVAGISWRWELFINGIVMVANKGELELYKWLW